MEKVVSSKIYLRGGVFKMHVLYFGEWRDGSLHDGMINLKKTSKSIYKCKLIFWDQPKLLEQIYYFG